MHHSNPDIPLTTASRQMPRHAAPRGFPTWTLATWAVVISLLFGTMPNRARAQGTAKYEAQLIQAQELVDAGRSDSALVLLDQMLSKGSKDGRALLLRSTARIMEGEIAAGVDDLHQAVKVDPKLRQAWLNLAGLEIAQRRFDEGYAALLEAQKLDPAASDNDLNLGAVLVLRGQVAEGKQHFERYLVQQDRDAEAHYLVAANYALAGVQSEAVTQLRRAIELNERFRLRARTDERFVGLDAEAYRQLLTSDLYQPPPGTHQASTAYKQGFDPKNNKLLYAVLGALKKCKIPYDPNVEANEVWALVWAEKLRIKVSSQSNGTGLVSFSAVEESFSPEEWEQTTQQLFRTIYDLLELADVLGS